MQPKLPFFHPTLWLATWFYSGLFPKAPGTVGSLAALPFAGYLYHQLGLAGFFVATGLCFGLGWLVSAHYATRMVRDDPKEVVIDEVAGMWLTLALVISLMPASPFTGMSGITANTLWLTLPCFLAFRFFDIRKPWFVGVCDHKVKGGLGIMLDDIAAACLAAPTVLALQYILIMAL